MSVFLGYVLFLAVFSIISMGLYLGLKAIKLV